MGKGNGKGTGKGHDDCDPTECTPMLCFCIFLWVCLPPILIVFGIIYLVASATDSRGVLMAPFNTVI